MKNKKGFTLIELLAVIIILGVLMLIAIPSVTEYIANSRRKTYISTVHRYVEGGAIKVNSLEFLVTDLDTTYYIPISCIPLEKGGKSPYGKWDAAYIVITFNGNSYDYYWTGRDESGYGTLLTNVNILTPDFVRTNTKAIDTSIGVGERTKIALVDSTCNVDNAQIILASENINERDTLYNGTETIQPEIVDKDVNPGDPDYHCYNFNSVSKTLMSYSNDSSCPKDAVIPNTINGVAVENIAVSAFASCNLNSIHIGSNVKVIGGRAFENQTFNANVVIPNNVTEIGSFAFNNVTVNGSVKIGNGVSDIGEAAFQGVKSTGGLTLGSNLSSIGNYSFRYASFVGDLVIPNSITIIKESSFNEVKFTGRLILGTGVNTLVQYAFYKSTFTGDLIIPGNVKLIANSAFRESKFSTGKLVLEEGIQEIQQHAFLSAQMTGDLKLPDSITIIGAEAFRDNNFINVSVASSLSLPANAFVLNPNVSITIR